MFDYGWLDAHCHLTDERIFHNLVEEISAAEEEGVSGFVSSVLCEEEYNLITHKDFEKYDKFIEWSAGIHPFYEKSSERDFDALVELCEQKRIIAVGEIGLDKRNNDFEWQKKVLLKQLDLAKNYHLPVIFHIVKQHYEIYKIIKNDFPKIFGFIHGFSASKEIFELYSKFDLALSLNLRLPEKEVVKLVLKRGFYLVETDAPYLKERGSADEFNHLKNLSKVAKNIERLTGISAEEIKKKQFENFKSIFG